MFNLCGRVKIEVVSCATNLGWEGLPKLEGKRMQVMLAPKIVKKKSGNELGKLHREKPADEAPSTDTPVEEVPAAE